MKAVADRAAQDLARYREAMRLIVEDDAIQVGAATFRGTRILVHQIADLVGQGPMKRSCAKTIRALRPR